MDEQGAASRRLYLLGVQGADGARCALLDLVVVRIGFTKREDDSVLENEDRPTEAALLRQILTALQ